MFSYLYLFYVYLMVLKSFRDSDLNSARILLKAIWYASLIEGLKKICEFRHFGETEFN